MTEREKIIRNYIDAYNKFDIAKMVVDLDENVVFENVTNHEKNMSLKGIKSFIEQAEQAKDYFSERTQTIKFFIHRPNESEVELDYHAILANDFPNGMKKGDELNLQGKSIFTFSGGKIIKLVDIS